MCSVVDIIGSAEPLTIAAQLLVVMLICKLFEQDILDLQSG
jgi:hypothetical protein